MRIRVSIMNTFQKYFTHACIFLVNYIVCYKVYGVLLYTYPYEWQSNDLIMGWDETEFSYLKFVTSLKIFPKNRTLRKHQ